MDLQFSNRACAKSAPLSLRAAQRRSNLHTAIGDCFVAKTAPRNDKRRRGFVKRLCTHPEFSKSTRGHYSAVVAKWVCTSLFRHWKVTVLVVSPSLYGRKIFRLSGMPPLIPLPPTLPAKRGEQGEMGGGAALPPATTPSFDSPSPLGRKNFSPQRGRGRGWGYAFAPVQKVG